MGENMKNILTTIGVAILSIIFFMSLSSLVFLGTEKAYASVQNMQLLLGLNEVEDKASSTGINRDVLYGNTQMQSIFTDAEINQDQKIKAIVLELNKTKEELRNTNATLKSLSDNMAEHFISNFRDVTSLIGVGLGILAGIIGTIIWQAIRILNNKIKDRVTESHLEMLEYSESQVSACLLAPISAHCLNLYKDFDFRGDSRQKRMLHDSYLKIARSISNQAYLNAQKLKDVRAKLSKVVKLSKDEKLSKNDNDIIFWCTNNKLFYMVTPLIDKDAEPKSTLEIQEIRGLYNEMKKIFSTYDKESLTNFWWQFEETLIWASYNMKYYLNISDVQAPLLSLLTNRNLSLEWRKEVQQRYTKCMEHELLGLEKLDILQALTRDS